MVPVHPLRTLLLAFSGWIARRQSDVIDYLREENRVLKERLEGRSLRLNDDQRRRLAARAKLLAARRSSSSPRSSRRTP